MRHYLERGRGGREAATEGRAGRGQAGLLLGQAGLATGLIFGAAGPVTSPVSLFGHRHVSHPPRHHA